MPKPAKILTTAPSQNLTLMWRQSFQRHPRTTKRFNEFKTVDWVHQTYLENRNYEAERTVQASGVEAGQPDSSVEQSVQDTFEMDSFDLDDDDNDGDRSQLIQRLHKVSVIRSRMWITLQTWLCLTLIGLAIGSIAGSINMVSEWLGDIKEGHCTEGIYLNRNFCCWGDSDECSNWQPWTNHWLPQWLIYIVVSVTFGTIAALLCQFYAPAAAGSGISEVKCIVSGFVMEGFLGWWTLAVKAAGLPLVIASGLNVGKEGPSVHYAACIGNVIAKWFPNFRKSYINQSSFLTAAAGTGVAVAFASPIGGVLFGIEEITSNFRLSTMWKSYYTAMVATGVLSAINPFRTGQLVSFQVHYDTAWHSRDVPFFLLLGVFGGIYGILVSRYNVKAVAFRQKYLENPVKEVALLVLLTAVVGYWNQFIRLDMTEGMGILFSECASTSNSTIQNQLCAVSESNAKMVATIVSLLIATLMRCVLVIISYNCKVPCGIFVPSMAAGATFGKAVGLIAEMIYGEGLVVSGTYAFLGAGAALCGITNLTLTVVIIMFEVTGALRYVIPTMMVVIVTKLITDKFGLGLGGIADQMIRFNGIPFLDSKEEHSFGDAKLASAMVSKVVSIPYTGLTLKELQLLLKETEWACYPVVDPKTLAVLAVADRRTLQTGCSHATGSEDTPVDLVSAEDYADLTGVHIDQTESALLLDKYVRREVFRVDIVSSLSSVMDLFIKLGPHTIVVEDSGRLAGLITKKDLARFELYLHEKEKGDVFINSTDHAVFEKIWSLLKKADGAFKWIHPKERIEIDIDG